MMFDQALATCTRSLGVHPWGSTETKEAFCDGQRFHGPVLLLPDLLFPVLVHAEEVRSHSASFEIVEVGFSCYLDDPKRDMRGYVMQDDQRALTLSGYCNWECDIELTFNDTCCWPFEQYGELMAALKPWLRSLLNVDQGSEYQKECWQ